MKLARALGLALVLRAVAGVFPLHAQQRPALPTDARPPAISLHQEIDFSASPDRVYHALMDTDQFTAFSGRPATIDGAVGGAFSLFSGHIVGRNLELVPQRRIVQAWRVVDWPEGVYSIARFDFRAHGSGTRVVLDHTGFPAGLRDHLAAGWYANYWTLLARYLR